MMVMMIRAEKLIRYKTIVQLRNCAVKEDRKTGKWCRSRVCLRDLTVAAFATLSHVGHSCDNIAGA